MLRLASVLALVAALAAVAGCGGQKVSADEVPGAPVALTVPEVTKGGSSQLAGNSSSSSSSSASADATATPDGTATSTTTPSGGTGTTQSGGTTTGTTGGTQQTQQNNAQSQNGGQQPFDDFCKNNPGAC
jgi:hypothetical protein